MAITASPVISTSSVRPAHRPVSRQIATQTPVRLTRRGRRVIATLAALPVAVLLAIGTAHRADAADQHQMTTVVVKPGQNLWQIAVQIAPQSDPRAVIYDIEQINGLESSVVSVGQQLIVPTHS